MRGGFLLNCDSDWWTWVNATCTHRVNENILKGKLNTSQDALKGCKSHINRNSEEALRWINEYSELIYYNKNNMLAVERSVRCWSRFTCHASGVQGLDPIVRIFTCLVRVPTTILSLLQKSQQGCMEMRSVSQTCCKRKARIITRRSSRYCSLCSRQLHGTTDERVSSAKTSVRGYVSVRRARCCSRASARNVLST